VIDTGAYYPDQNYCKYFKENSSTGRLIDVVKSEEKYVALWNDHPAIISQALLARHAKTNKLDGDSGLQ